MNEYRVVCPDGTVAETDYDDHTVGFAFTAAASMDETHDGARCVGPHRVERSLGWEPVTLRTVG